MKRLYELKRGDTIRVNVGRVFEFDHVDGMFGLMVGPDGELDHLAAYTPLEKVGHHYEIIEEPKEDKG